MISGLISKVWLSYIIWNVFESGLHLVKTSQRILIHFLISSDFKFSSNFKKFNYSKQFKTNIKFSNDVNRNPSCKNILKNIAQK